MSTFFQQTAQAMIAKHIGRFPLLKLEQVIDWQPIEHYLNHQRTRYLRDHRGRPAYPLLSMFKAVLLGQWHSLSDPELEHSLITRIDFHLFCRFDELSIPDHSTLCRYRNRPAQDNTLAELPELINRQLTDQGLKVEKASAAIVDATIIQTAGGKQRQAIEVDDEGQVSSQTTPSKDSDARWVKKDGRYRLGYKQHTRTDTEGYIEKLHITAANAHECKHLLPLLEGLAKDTTVYADKGCDSMENRQHLEEHQLRDGIMCKSHRNRPLTEAQTKRNRHLSKTRYVVEQSFGTLHRKFRHARAAYFGLSKVSAQSHLKAMFLNLLKAANRLRAPVAV
ncbi:IS5 family transposase [Neisseria zoodegmatis]|uniref:IS1106A3 transposase n=1 Tax=Neisseria zoodegmatis TaxID=326523 RepID=A0AB38DRV2_9NEIS|nr:IS5 family transposase [Neisseria zoodegmatis]OSI09877.1 IS5 family transposase [Neisseria zoodegmatis]SNU79722.1 IS1106A3 transposase [Neisseria zoodegmatis]